MSKGGVLHRGPVGTRKRGRDWAEVGGRKIRRGQRQAVALPQDQDKAGRPTQTQKRSRESPARMARRTWQREHTVTPTQAPRPAPDISRKMRPKDGDKEGWVVPPRAAPRPTRTHRPWEGVRPRPGAGQSQPSTPNNTFFIFSDLGPGWRQGGHGRPGQQ